MSYIVLYVHPNIYECYCYITFYSPEPPEFQCYCCYLQVSPQGFALFRPFMAMLCERQ